MATNTMVADMRRQIDAERRAAQQRLNDLTSIENALNKTHERLQRFLGNNRATVVPRGKRKSTKAKHAITRVLNGEQPPMIVAIRHELAATPNVAMDAYTIAKLLKKAGIVTGSTNLARDVRKAIKTYDHLFTPSIQIFGATGRRSRKAPEPTYLLAKEGTSAGIQSLDDARSQPKKRGDADVAKGSKPAPKPKANKPKHVGNNLDTRRLSQQGTQPTMKDAIMDVLNNSLEPLFGRRTAELLTATGYQSSPKNLVRQVMKQLHELKNEGKVKYTEGKGYSPARRVAPSRPIPMVASV